MATTIIVTQLDCPNNERVEIALAGTRGPAGSFPTYPSTTGVYVLTLTVPGNVLSWEVGGTSPPPPPSYSADTTTWTGDSLTPTADAA